MSDPIIRWDAKGVPHSLLFRDKYFCTQNGYEESFYVSCQGNNLQERFLTLDPKVSGTFTIIETGFGTGLSFCSAWYLWKQCAPVSWKLHFVSLELYPLNREDVDRALSVWPNLSDFRQALVQQYVPAPGEVKHFEFKEDRIQLSIVFEEVVDALRTIKEKNIAPHGADAWFLNGFSPFSNPLMWRPEVFKGMALLSKKGSTLATFTVAGFVRRGLEAEGFKVERIPGYGTKKTVLVGSFQNIL